MEAVIDIECDDLNATKIWCLVAKDILTGEVHVFRNTKPSFEHSVRDFLSNCRVLIGHNLCGFDYPVLQRLVGGPSFADGRHKLVDTLVISRLLDFDRSDGHSLRSWGVRLGCPKTEFSDWSHLSEEMVEYCIQDVELCYRLYNQFLPYINSPRWARPIDLEHFMAGYCQRLHVNGFHFNLDKAQELRHNINEELKGLDEELKVFPPKSYLIREITPRVTAHGTLHRGDFRWVEDGDLTPYSEGATFSRIGFEPFNPKSPKQRVERLNEAGWRPTEKTKGHIQLLRDIKKGNHGLSKDELAAKVQHFKEYGWTVSEANINTLPEDAPPAARKLVRHILLTSRLSDLDEWIAEVKPDGRIHGTVNPIGAWSHRCSHSAPNIGNIPREDAPFGAEMRSLWGVEQNRYLVGVDAEGIQLRVLAHYINDPRFTHSVIAGKKEDGTDPHSLNKQALGRPCKSRNAAKTFIYAWLLGAGIGKVSEILECSTAEARQANDDFIGYYPGLKVVKEELIPRDARRGYFEGWDGRYIKIWGEDARAREHFALAGYLQAGEAIIMKEATRIWSHELREEIKAGKVVPVNFVHDEWQTEIHASYDLALHCARTQADAIRIAGERFNLRCPMAGSILNGHGKIAIGSNWLETH